MIYLRINLKTTSVNLGAGWCCDVTDDAVVMAPLQWRMLSEDVQLRWAAAAVQLTYRVVHEARCAARPLSRGSSTPNPDSISTCRSWTSPLTRLGAAVAGSRRPVPGTCSTVTRPRSNDVMYLSVPTVGSASATSTGLLVTWLNLSLTATRRLRWSRRRNNPQRISFVLTVSACTYFKYGLFTD